jgi:hypothetical protein
MRADGGFFGRMSAEWRVEQARCIQDIERHTTADQSYLAASARRRLFTVRTFTCDCDDVLGRLEVETLIAWTQRGDPNVRQLEPSRRMAQTA